VKKRMLVLVAIAAAFPTLALAASGTVKLEAAKMTGAQEKPAGAPGATGYTDIDITGTKVCWTIRYAKLGGTPMAAHIHKGKAGVAGPVVVPLGAKFAAKGCIASSAAVVKAIEANPAGYYVNIHTAKFPGGAVRGQLAKEK